MKVSVDRVDVPVPPALCPYHLDIQNSARPSYGSYIQNYDDYDDLDDDNDYNVH